MLAFPSHLSTPHRWLSWEGLISVNFHRTSFMVRPRPREGGRRGVLRASLEVVHRVEVCVPWCTGSGSLSQGRPWPPNGWGGAPSVETPLAAIWGQRWLGCGAGAQGFLHRAEFKPRNPNSKKERKPSLRTSPPTLKKRYCLNVPLKRLLTPHNYPDHCPRRVRMRGEAQLEVGKRCRPCALQHGVRPERPSVSGKGQQVPGERYPLCQME